jgi:hypothetical protein
MQNEIDELMSLDPLELSKDEEGIAKLVEHFRSTYRTNESSAKFSRTGNPADRPKIDFSALGIKQEEPKIIRRKI